MEKLLQQASGKYMIMPIEKIGEFDREINMWRVINSDTDPEIISL